MATQAGRAAPSPELVRARVRGLPRRFRHESCDGLSAEWELRVGSQRFVIAVADGACTVREGSAASPQAVVATEPRTWLAIDEGLITGGQAFLERRLRATGNLDLAVRLQTLFRPYRRRRRPADLDPSVPGFRWRYLMGFTRVFPARVGTIPFPLRERWMQVLIRRLFAEPDRLPSFAYTAAAGEFIRIYRDPKARMALFSSLRHIVTERPEPFYGSLRKIKQPTLVLFGERDRLVSPRLGVRLAQNIPGPRFVVLPDAGHLRQFEATAQTLGALTKFLASAPQGKPLF